MKKGNQINRNRNPLVTVILMTVLVLCLGGCANNTIVPESEYSTKIMGRWQGMVGDSKEKMSINGNGTFNCQIYSMGFIATTLSQRNVTGMVYGTWEITGAIITLTITGAKNEKVTNGIAKSTIESFNVDELVLKSETGGTSSFHRVRAFCFNSQGK